MYCYNFFVSNNKNEKAQCKYVYVCVCLCTLNPRRGSTAHMELQLAPARMQQYFAARFFGPACAFLRVCLHVYMCVCVFGSQAEFVIFFCNIFFCVCRLTFWLGGVSLRLLLVALLADF